MTPRQDSCQESSSVRFGQRFTAHCAPQGGTPSPLFSITNRNRYCGQSESRDARITSGADGGRARATATDSDLAGVREPARQFRRRIRCMEQSLQPGRVIGAGRGALILSMAGSGWLGWGLGVGHAYNAIVAPLFGMTTILLGVWSIWAMRTGRALRRQIPASTLSQEKFPGKSFAIIVFVEALAILTVILLASGRAHRPDLATDGCALVIGMHYLPLAKIFRAPILAVLGVLISLWCVASWVLFRFDPLIMASTIGTGILFWATSVAVLLRTCSLACALRSAP